MNPFRTKYRNAQLRKDPNYFKKSAKKFNEENPTYQQEYQKKYRMLRKLVICMIVWTWKNIGGEI